MNILIRIPNWLGDAVMATFALEILYKTYPQAHFYIVGSIVSGELFRHYPNTTIIFDKSKQSKYRLLNLYHLAKKIPRCDLAFTFQNNFLSALFLAFNRSKKRIGYSNQVRSIFLHIAPKRPKNTHEVLRFSQLVETIVPNHHLPPKLYLKKPKTLPKKLSQKLAGINAGAAFGSAKRWKEEYFAQVIAFLLKEDFTIFLFGTESEGVI
ncbi:MAG: glycosyltransferase family 9 protein, partial [Helicobacter sp.]|nr:glycosyltransferase family 9 protein [Helicobacter sp.]